MGLSIARVVMVGCALAAVTGCKKKQEPVPTEATAPVAIGVEGASCYSGPCNPGLACTPTTIICAGPDHPEHVAARQRAAERKAAFLAQSGVERPTQAEKPPPTVTPSPASTSGDPSPASGGGAVRLVRVANDGKGSWVIAACRPDERLVGGSCQILTSNLMNLPSFPVSDQPTDTVGGHWSCGWPEAPSDLSLVAFALCQRL